MSRDTLTQQAEALSSSLGRLLRGLNRLDPNSPTACLTMPQFRLCMLLREGPVPMSTLSQELGISLSAVTQIADRVERAGLVERVCPDDDRRVRLLRLTAQGEEMVRQRHARRLQRARAILAALEPQERVSVLAAFQRLAEVSRTGLPDPADELALLDEGHSLPPTESP